MKMGFFNRGIEATQKLADAHKASFSSNGIYDFYVKDGQEALMRFLTDEPVSFMAHNIKVGKAPRTFICTGDAECQGCKQADSFDPTKPNKPVVRAAYLVLDGTVTEKDEMQDGKPTGKKVQYTDQIKIMVRGTNDIAAIERCKEKYGLLGRAYYVSKNGKKNPYAFDRVDGCPHGKDEELWGQHELSAETIEKLIEKLPEKYRDLARQEGGFYNVIEALFTPYGVSSDSTEVPAATEVEEPQSLSRM